MEQTPQSPATAKPLQSQPPSSGPSPTPPPKKSNWWIWVVVAVVVIATVAAEEARTSSQTSSAPPPPTQVHYEVQSVSTNVYTGCTPGTSSGELSVRLYSPSQFPAQTSPTTEGSAAAFGIGLYVTNPGSTSQTLGCIWTYSPFTGDYTTGGSEEYITTYQPAGGPPITVPAGESVDVILYVGVPASANGGTLQLDFGVST